MAENVVTELATTTFKNNFIFYSVIVLLISHIGGLITKIVQIYRRLDRKEEIINKIAMDMVKIKKDEWSRERHFDVEFPVLTFFFNIREALKKRIRFNKGYQEWLAQKETEFSKKIEQFERKISDIEKEEESLYYVKESAKIPDSLKKNVKEIIQNFAENIQRDSNTIYGVDRYIARIHDVYAFRHREETEKRKNKEK